MSATHDAVAIRLGYVDRPARDNFLSDPGMSGPMRLDFDIWVVRGEDRIMVVDTGFSPEAGERRGRVLERRPAQALRELGIAPGEVTDVVVTHLHYDHAGNLGDFPDAHIWIQRAEVAYATGASMRHRQLSHFFDADDVCDLVRRTFDGRVRQIDGRHTLADGIELHQVGGHTPGLQVVRVRTERGWVVLASDALHYYANLELRNPFPSIVDVPGMLAGFDTVLELADGPDHIVPGHDPAVMQRYGTVSDDLPDEIEDFRSSVSAFASKTLAPDALARAHNPEFPWDVAELMGQQGLLGLTIPEAKGGQGASLLAAVVAIQAVAAHCLRSADIVQAGNFGAIRTFAEYASAEQREKYLPSLLSGKSVIGLSMSEPEAGSAVTDLQTTAVRKDDGFVINGTKVFGTHSADASVYLVYVRFGPGVGGIGSVLVDRDTPGLTVGEPSLFMNGEHWCQLYFEDCFVPDTQVLLGEGGFKRQITGFNVERLGNASRSLAVGRYAFDAAVQHVKEREQFGRPLAEFQGLQWMFAERAVALESAQLLLYRAAAVPDGELPTAYDTAVAKYAANEAGFGAADVAVQAMGGIGFSEESLVEYCFRRTRGWKIAGGSTEILKNRIAETVFDRRFSQRGNSSGERNDGVRR